jgi:hypothetical protein
MKNAVSGGNFGNHGGRPKHDDANKGGVFRRMRILNVNIRERSFHVEGFLVCAIKQALGL